MPCMGPTPPKKEEVKKVTEDVLEFLRKEHHVFFGEESSFPALRKNRKKTMKKLRKAIYEVLWQERCESF